jgi:Up-regulated During Septation
MHPQSNHLNTSDPVAMHLLMETAMVDSKEFEVLSFEEIEALKRERASLQNRIEATRRKLALERKLRDAAQSLNRLYSPKGRGDREELGSDGSQRSPRKARKSILGNRSSSEDMLNRTDDEFAASKRKCEELAEELSGMETRSEELARRILQHTAGILQLTHKGLKKNLPRDGLPQSPESMASVNHKSMTHLDGLDDFDDRSFYRSLEPFDDYGGGNRKAELQLLEQTQKQLDHVNNRLRAMVLQADPNQRLGMPPPKEDASSSQQSGAQIQAHLEYLAQALETMEAAQSRTVQDAQQSVYDSEDRMDDINLRLHGMLQRTNSLAQSPIDLSPDSTGKNLQSQLSFSSLVLERLDRRVENLVEQKEILSRQIQQQRELNSKSDEQRDAQIMELTNELSNAKRHQAQYEQDAQNATDQIHLLMEQLDSSRQESVLLDQKRQSDDRKLLQAEKNAKKRAEDNLVKLKATLQAETDAKRRAEDALIKLRKTMQAEKDGKQRAEDSLIEYQRTMQEERESRGRAGDSLTELQRTLKTEKDSRGRAEENFSKLRGTLQAEKESRSKAEESLSKLRATLLTEQESRKRAEESLNKLQATLQAGNNAQRQINENISELQGSLQAEKEARKRAEDSLAQLQGSLQKEKDASRRADNTLSQLQETLQAEKDMARDLQGQLSEVQGDLDEAQIDKAQAEAEVEKCRNEIKDLESAVIRAQTDLIVVRAELDGAYGTRAQRAADVTMNPAVQKEMDELNDKNTSLQNEIKYLKTQDSGGDELKKKVAMLQKELKETIEDYEQMTKASIEFEKDREQLEASVDAMREKCEGLEGQLSEEKVKWLGMKSPGVHGPSSPSTSTMVLKNEFKKMMRDTRAENLKALRVRLPLCIKMTLLTRVNRPSKTKGESLRHLCALSRLNSY